MWRGVDPVWLTAVTGLGWLWGSFLNQVVDRTPRRRHGASACNGAENEASAAASPEPAAANAGAGAAARAEADTGEEGTRNAGRPLGLLHPARSVCLGCGRVIPWYENIPIFTYLALKGRCRACGVPFGRRTLVMEVATPLAFAALYLGLIGFGRGPLVLAWALAAAGWALTATALLWERRRPGFLFMAIGAAMCAAAAAFF